MVMRLGAEEEEGGEERVVVYTFLVGPDTEMGKHTDQSANTPHILTHMGMGMHANTGMYINAQMPTLNTEI